MVQSNSIGATMETAFGIPSWVVGIMLIVICAFIFLGGVQRLASVTEKVVPIMAAIFLLGGLIVPQLVVGTFCQVEKALALGDIDGGPTQLLVEGGIVEQVEVLEQQ